jgi:hypothetical protein
MRRSPTGNHYIQGHIIGIQVENMDTFSDYLNVTIYMREMLEESVHERPSNTLHICAESTCSAAKCKDCQPGQYGYSRLYASVYERILRNPHPLRRRKRRTMGVTRVMTAIQIFFFRAALSFSVAARIKKTMAVMTARINRITVKAMSI